MFRFGKRKTFTCFPTVCFARKPLLEHSNVFGSAKTSNMILLVNDLLQWDLFHIIIRFVSLIVYALGIIFTLWMAKYHPIIQKRICIIIDCLAALILGFLPENIHPVIALYPVAFAMSIQWCSFRGIRENPSAATFSTGNFRQLVTTIEIQPSMVWTPMVFCVIHPEELCELPDIPQAVHPESYCGEQMLFLFPLPFCNTIL